MLDGLFCLYITYAWEQRKLERLGDFSAGGDVNKEQLSTLGAYPVIANALTNDGIIGYVIDLTNFIWSAV